MPYPTTNSVLPKWTQKVEPCAEALWGVVDADDTEAVQSHELANPKVLKIPGLLGNRGTTLKDEDHMLAKA